MRLPRWFPWAAMTLGAVAVAVGGVWLMSLASDLRAILQSPSAHSDARPMSPAPGARAQPSQPSVVAGGPPESGTLPEPRARALPPPTPGSWEATLLTGRARTLGRTGLDLEQGLDALQLDLGSCFRKETQASFQGRAVLEVEQPALDDTGTTVVVLQVEAGMGELKVVDAPVEIRAGASDATIACIQGKLRGVRVPSEGKPPAPRFRLRYDVTP